MSWEHELAGKIINRDPSISSGWYTGQVLSPTMSIDPESGEPTYSGPLIITAFDGDVTLREDRLVSLSSEVRPYAGCAVALMGDVFAHGTGAQKVLVLGVISNAV